VTSPLWPHAVAPLLPDEPVVVPGFPSTTTLPPQLDVTIAATMTWDARMSPTLPRSRALGEIQVLGLVEAVEGPASVYARIPSVRERAPV
jgi:hypothetical protein